MANFGKVMGMLKNVEELGQSIKIGETAIHDGKLAEGTSTILNEVHQLRQARTPATSGDPNIKLESTATSPEPTVRLREEQGTTKTVRSEADQAFLDAHKEFRLQEDYDVDIGHFVNGLRITEFMNFQEYDKETEAIISVLGNVSPEVRAMQFPSAIVNHLDARTPPMFETKAATRLETFQTRLKGDFDDLMRRKPDSDDLERAPYVERILAKRTFEFFNEHGNAMDVEKSKRVTALRGALDEMKPDPDFHKKFYFTDSNFLIAEERQKFDLKNPDMDADMREAAHSSIGKHWYGQYRQLEDMSNLARQAQDKAQTLSELRNGLDNGLMPPHFDVNQIGLRPMLDLINEDKAAYTAAHPELTPNQLRLHLEDLSFVRLAQHRMNKYGRFTGEVSEHAEPELQARYRMMALRYGLIKGELPPGYKLSDFGARDWSALNKEDHDILWSDTKMMWKGGKDNYQGLYDYARDRRMQQYRELTAKINEQVPLEATMSSDANAPHTVRAHR